MTENLHNGALEQFKKALANSGASLHRALQRFPVLVPRRPIPFRGASEHQVEEYYSKIYRHFQLWNEILSRPECEGMNRLCEFNEEFQRKVDAIDEQSKKYMEEIAAQRETEKEDPGSYSRTIDNLVRKGILKEVVSDAENRRATVVIGDHAPNCSNQARKCHRLPL